MSAAVTGRLSHTVRCAGCASKIAPSKLMAALAGLPIVANRDLLVGLATGDDAGVFRISPDTALVQTLDFFTPIVDDPLLFGRIAAANALSDVYAMGGIPLTAMNVVCFPINDRDPRELLEILQGGAQQVALAGATLVGGHSVVDPEPKYGLSVTGIVHPEHIATNAGARPGDLIVLTKPLGTGIISTAAKFDECPPESFAAAANGMTMLNSGAAEAMRELGIGGDLPVHAATDITGFGLIGHLYQLAKASCASLRLYTHAIPIYPGAAELAAAGSVTAGGKANREYVGTGLIAEAGLSRSMLDILADPQSSGGLAICVDRDHADRLVEALKRYGTLEHVIIGEITKSEQPTISLV